MYSTYDRNGLVWFHNGANKIKNKVIIERKGTMRQVTTNYRAIAKILRAGFQRSWKDLLCKPSINKIKKLTHKHKFILPS